MGVTVVRGIGMMVALALGGCTSYWKEPGQWQQKYATDSAFCQRQAAQGTDSNRVFRQCMEARGWPQQHTQ